MRFTRGNTIVALEKLWYLQKAHVSRRVARGGDGFEALVDRVHDAIRARLEDLGR